jgi:hypothetical protein
LFDSANIKTRKLEEYRVRMYKEWKNCLNTIKIISTF